MGNSPDDIARPTVAHACGVVLKRVKVVVQIHPPAHAVACESPAVDTPVVAGIDDPVAECEGVLVAMRRGLTEVEGTHPTVARTGGDPRIAGVGRLEEILEPDVDMILIAGVHADRLVVVGLRS